MELTALPRPNSWIWGEEKREEGKEGGWKRRGGERKGKGAVRRKGRGGKDDHDSWSLGGIDAPARDQEDMGSTPGRFIFYFLTNLCKMFNTYASATKPYNLVPVEKG